MLTKDEEMTEEENLSESIEICFSLIIYPSKELISIISETDDI